MTDRVVKARVTLPRVPTRGERQGATVLYFGRQGRDVASRSAHGERACPGVGRLCASDDRRDGVVYLPGGGEEAGNLRVLRRAPSLRTARWYPPQARLPCRSVRKWRAVWFWPQWPSACVRAPRPLCAGSLAARALTGCGRGARVPGSGPAAAAQGRCEVRLSLPIPAPLGGLPQS